MNPIVNEDCILKRFVSRADYSIDIVLNVSENFDLSQLKGTQGKALKFSLITEEQAKTITNDNRHTSTN